MISDADPRSVTLRHPCFFSTQGNVECLASVCRQALGREQRATWFSSQSSSQSTSTSSTCIYADAGAAWHSPSSKGHPLDEDADDAECSKCSPVFHGGPLTSPIGRIEEKVDDPLQMKEGFSMLRASAWLSHNIGSQASYRLALPDGAGI